MLVIVSFSSKYQWLQMLIFQVQMIDLIKWTGNKMPPTNEQTNAVLNLKLVNTVCYLSNEVKGLRIFVQFAFTFSNFTVLFNPMH